jgi:NADPH:quinone reductase-like Zn-dependent oxidoreductase
MRRVCFREYGGPEVLKVEDVARPGPGEGELLVEVGAAGVTLPVVRQTHGSPDGGGVPLPHAPGGEVSGRVVATGPGVTGWEIGQRVAGLAFSGAYAEFAAVPAAFMFAVPDEADDATAVLLVRSGQVALGALRASGLRRGESVLVTAAAGGVGHLAVQLAGSLGAGRVVAAVGSAGKEAFLRDLGADEVVTYDEDGWGEPVDVVLDGVGGEVVQRAGLRSLAPLGRLVAYNGVGGVLDVNELRMHGRSVIGFAMPHLVARRRDLFEQHQRELWNLYAAGHLTAAVHRTLSLDEAAEAHRIIENRENRGKVILAPSR